MALIGEGFADRIHLSHDGACFLDFFVGNPYFANEKPDYLLISEQVLPALLEAGVTQDQIDQMMVANPVRFFGGGGGGGAVTGAAPARSRWPGRRAPAAARVDDAPHPAAWRVWPVVHGRGG